MPRRGHTAIVANRTTDRPAETAEVRALAESAGYEVVAECTQVRRADSTFQFGRGKVDELVRTREETGADVVVFDNDLGPDQAFALEDAVGAEVIDRKRLVLDVFAERAETRRARLEVRLAELRYDLPRAEAYAKRGEDSGRQGFRSAGEDPASQVRADYERRIKEVDEALDSVEGAAKERRRARRESGRALVALAGYTNAGKSTLLRRLADDLAVDENAGRHADLDASAESRDRLFTTLGTITRRGTLGDANVLLTDTVGFIGDLPHWLVSSFESTLAESYDADAVALVADASDPVDDVERKVRTSLDVLGRYRDDGVVPVLNKRDVATDLGAKRDLVADVAEAYDCVRDARPAAISALRGTGLDELADAVTSALPDRETATLRMPNGDEAMSVVSWCYDRADVRDVAYDDEVVVELRARPAVLARARAKVESVGGDGSATWDRDAGIGDS